MEPLVFLAILALLNGWATYKISRIEQSGLRRNLLAATVWIAPGVGLFVAWLHCATGVKKHEPEEDIPLERELLDAAPIKLSVPGLPEFDVLSHLRQSNGLEYLDWMAVLEWAGAATAEEDRRRAIESTQRAWLLHLRDALGESYRLYEDEQAWVLSSLATRIVLASAHHIEQCRERILDQLQGVASAEPGKRSVLIALDDEDTYYRYVAAYYPDEGEFALSHGVFIHFGCPHFVVVKNELERIESTILHEMTHDMLAKHLLPTWLDEGIAVNMQLKYAGEVRMRIKPSELRHMHRQFWGPSELDEFWAGHAFHRPDAGQMLAYDLARLLVRYLSNDWTCFRAFILAADRKDAGRRSALEHLKVDLDRFVAVLLEREAEEVQVVD